MPQIDFNGKQIKFVWKVPNAGGGPGGPFETFLPGQARATARVHVAYDLRMAFLDAVVGWGYVRTEGARRVLRRNIPLEYPYHRGLWCIGAARTEGLSPYGTTPAKTLNVPPGVGLIPAIEKHPAIGQPEYLDCGLDLQFSSLPFKPLPDTAVASKDSTYGLGLPDEGDALSRGIRRYITREIKPAGKQVTLQGSPLHYKEDGIPVLGTSNVLNVPMMTVVYHWHEVPEDALPTLAWLEVPGSLNKFAFDGFPPQTLLCEHPGAVQETSPFGEPMYKVSVPMTFLPNFFNGVCRGHNWFPRVIPTKKADGTPYPADRVGKLEWAEICTRGSTGVNPGTPPKPIIPLNGTAPYRVTDFRKLFRPNP